VQDVMPNPVKIEWITVGEEHATIEEGQVIVCLRNELDNARNVVAATMLYLQSGFLRQSRPYTDQRVQQALDLKMAWRTLQASEESDIAHYFLGNVYNPIVSQDKAVEVYCSKLEDLDTRGVLTRILLRELRGVGRKASGRLPDPGLREETQKFTDFVHTIVASEKGAHYPLNFLGKTIRAGVELVARFQTIATSGLRVHKRWLKRKVRMGLETIYILAAGPKNVDLARHLGQWAQEEGLIQIVRRQTLIAPTKSGEPMPTVIITCHSSQARTDAILDPEEEVQAALVRRIPEIATGQVEVLDIAREPGIQSKVVIRSTISSQDPTAVCQGRDNQHIDELMQDLGESIWFVPWSEDAAVLLVDCLGIPHDSLINVEIDQKSGASEIVVEDSRTAAMAVGTKGSNVRLTQEITGLKIQVLTIDETQKQTTLEAVRSPEEILRNALVQEIPEINAGNIEIVDIIREPGVQSKVVVRGTGDIKKPVSICVGKGKQHVNALMEELEESVWFVAWDDDLETFLINCLGIYPDRVISAEIEPQLGTAEIVVEDSRTCAMAIGKDGITVRQVAQLTGLRRIQVRCLEDIE